MNPRLQKALNVIEPYVIYGPVYKSIIRKILNTRGFAIKDKEFIPIKNEEVIEEGLGKHDIVCIEDIGKYF